MSIDFPAEQHEMRLEKSHPSGAEEWACPTCGRRFVMQWPPAFKRIVLEAGDEYALHSSGKGGLRMGAVQVNDGHHHEEERVISDELRAAIEEILENIDFDDLGNPPV